MSNPRALSPEITLQDDIIQKIPLRERNTLQDDNNDDLPQLSSTKINNNDNSSTSTTLIGPFKNNLEVCLFLM
jgi:hypothetical protein